MNDDRKRVLDLLAEVSTLNPEIRMGQWLLMFAYSARGTKPESIYEVEDEELILVMEQFLEKRRVESPVAEEVHT